jgi:purine operon repressor
MMRRSERLPILTKILLDNPERVISLSELADKFQAAKSTISEDLAIIRDVFAREGTGRVETLIGASGGVRYSPILNAQKVQSVVQEICEALTDPNRILPGGFLYMSDLLSSPDLMKRVGEVFATYFYNRIPRPDVVVTLETSGIPIALMTARAVDVPLAIVRRTSRMAEGSVLTMNYISGSAKRIETMSLSRRALFPGAKVLLIDDFMKAGGSARGLVDLMEEFGAEVLGIGVLIATEQPKRKLVQEYVSLAVLENVDEQMRQVLIRPSSWVLEQ